MSVERFRLPFELIQLLHTVKKYTSSAAAQETTIIITTYTCFPRKHTVGHVLSLQTGQIHHCQSPVGHTLPSFLILECTFSEEDQEHPVSTISGDSNYPPKHPDGHNYSPQVVNPNHESTT